MKGVSLIAIQQLLGHADIKMTMRYAHLAPATLRSAVGVLSSRGVSYGQQAVTAIHTQTEVKAKMPV